MKLTETQLFNFWDREFCSTILHNVIHLVSTNYIWRYMYIIDISWYIRVRIYLSWHAQNIIFMQVYTFLKTYLYLYLE
jgi:hypothetical protein